MILRRITEHVKAQNWFAVGVEFVIVVVGVFVGLQAQDWSTARAERSAEHAAIERLIIEYKLNLKLLDEDKGKSQKTMAATERLLAMISPEPAEVITDGALTQTFLDCLTNPKFIPTHGTTNSLVASGDLRLIGDPEIQRMLILGLTVDYLAWPTLLRPVDDSNRPSALKSDDQGLFSSKRFEGLLNNRRYNTRVSIRRMEELEADTQELVNRLETRFSTFETT